MTRCRLLSQFVIAAIIGILWFANSSANDEPPAADSNLTKPESSIETPATPGSSMPDISGEWEMGRKVSFGRCTVRRVTDGTADFQTYMNKQPQPWLKLKWLEKEHQFQGTVIEKNGPLNGATVTFTMTLDETGNKLNVNASFEDLTPDLVEAKKKELKKDNYVTQEEIDELFDMRWTRRKDFGQKLDDKPIQIVSNPKSNGQANNAKENQSEAVDPDLSISDSNPVSVTDITPVRTTSQSADQPNSPSSTGFPGPGSPNMTSISELASGGSAPITVLGDAVRPFSRVSSQELLVIETKDGLSAYSTLTGKWDRVVVGLPKDGKARLEQSITSSNFCSVIVDDQLFGFSSKAGKWSKLTIPLEYVGKVKPEHGWNLISVTIGDRTFVLSPVTGKWTSSNDDSSVKGAVEEQAPSLGLIHLRASATIGDAEKKSGLAIDTSESHRLSEAIAKHELKAAMSAEKIRALSKTLPPQRPTTPTIEDLRRDVEASLSSAFEFKLQLEKLRVKELHSRLSRLEQQIGRRQAQQKQIIERRTNELIAGEETEWNNDPNLTTRVDRSSKAEHSPTMSPERAGPSVVLNRQSGADSPTKSTQVRFLTFQGAESIVPKIVYLEETIGLPARLNFERGTKEVRHYPLQLISGYFNPGSRPLLLDVYPANVNSEAYLNHNSVPIEITVEDLDQVVSGNFLTKVVYLPHAKVQQLAIANVETIVSSRLDPGIDPIVEAERRGTVLAVLRFPSDENLKTEPTRWRPQQASKLSSGQKATHIYGVVRDGVAPQPVAVTTDENGVLARSEPDQNSENLVPVPVLFPSGDELATNLVSAREEVASAQSELLRQEKLLKNHVTTVQEMENAKRRLETATRKEKILKVTYEAAIQDLQFQIEGAKADYELAETLSKQIGSAAQKGAVSQKASLEVANKSVQAHLTLKRLTARYEHYKRLGEGIAEVKGEPVTFTFPSDLQPLKQMGLTLVKLSADESSQLARTTTKYRGGLKILEVESKSVAAENGIQTGDILVGLDKWETLSLDNVSWITKQVAERPIDPLVRNPLVKFFFYRGTEMRFGFIPFVSAKETAPQETELDVLPKIEISR